MQNIKLFFFCQHGLVPPYTHTQVVTHTRAQKLQDEQEKDAGDAGDDLTTLTEIKEGAKKVTL